MARRSGLGKGLGALIPTEFEDENGVYREIDVSDIVPNRNQPREHFDEETLSSLTASVQEVGVIQPVVVRETEDGYELVAGSGAGERPAGPAWPPSRHWSGRPTTSRAS